MLRVYPGMDKLGRDYDTYDREGSSPERLMSDFEEGMCYLHPALKDGSFD